MPQGLKAPCCQRRLRQEPTGHERLTGWTDERFCPGGDVRPSSPPSTDVSRRGALALGHCVPFLSGYTCTGKWKALFLASDAESETSQSGLITARGRCHRARLPTWGARPRGPGAPGPHTTGLASAVTRERPARPAAARMSARRGREDSPGPAAPRDASGASSAPALGAGDTCCPRARSAETGPTARVAPSLLAFKLSNICPETRTGSRAVSFVSAGEPHE